MTVPEVVFTKLKLLDNCHEEYSIPAPNLMKIPHRNLSLKDGRSGRGALHERRSV